MICCACFSFLSFLNAQANNQPPGKHVTLKAQNVAIYDVFKAIFKQTSFKVSYANSMFDDRQKVSVNFSNTPLAEVMDFLLKGSGMEWTMNEQVIILSKKETETPVKNLGDSTITMTTITGKITDAQGNAIPGATVVVKGTKNGVVTNGDGFFTLPDVKMNSMIVVTSVGYEPREIKVKGKSILTQLNVKVSDLDETVVIGYGTTTRRLSTSNITTIKADVIEKQPVNNPLLALQGRVPGLFVTQSNGLPGSGVIVRVQGQNSISRGSDPLYVIDGIPYTSQLLQSIHTTGPLGNSGSFEYGVNGSPFSFINPADIESIDILKDADATAIYGSRAANGAILITTKKGKPGPTRVHVNLQHGWGKVARRLNLLNSQQYLEMRREALKNDGIDLNTPPYNDPLYRALLFPDLALWDTTRYTDWQNELLGGTAQYTDLQISVTGGTTNTNFIIGGGYHRETTVFPGDFTDQKASALFNINHASNNQKFKLQLSGNYLADFNRLPHTDLTFSATHIAPLAPPLYDEDGGLNWTLSSLGTSTFNNPLALYSYRRYNNTTNNLLSNLLISYQLLPGLEVKSSFGYTDMRTKEITTLPLLSVAPENRPNTSRETQFGNNKIISWNIEPQLNLKKDWNKSKVDILIGATIQQNSSNAQQLHSWGYVSDLVMEDIKAAAGISAMFTGNTVYKYNALFGRFNYNWRDKYILNITGRRDGSSRFGAANRFRNFGAIGAAWLFSNELWTKAKLPFLSFGKLRGSYGSLGSDQLGDYQYLTLYTTIPFVDPYQGSNGLAPSALPNPYLQWEETKKLQFGLELGFVNDKLSVTTNYFRNRSSNQLLSFKTAATTGFENVTSNFPAIVQNQGWEVLLNTANIQIYNLSWNGSLNFTVSKNKLVSFPDIEESPYRFLSIGESIYAFKYFHLIGVNEGTGIYQFEDSKGNPTYNPSNADTKVSIDPMPQLYGGFQNSISYKGLQLDFLFQFVKQKARGNALGFYPGQFSNGFGNQPVSVLNRWQQSGDRAVIQRYNSDGSLGTTYFIAEQSDAHWEDASYVRLKNLSFSWQLPNVWKQKMRVQNFRIYIQGQNLLTLTRYTGLDPESGNKGDVLPPLRVVTTGIQVTL
jgi:TonB-linked SusC/RagA family outer membrane protein